MIARHSLAWYAWICLAATLNACAHVAPLVSEPSREATIAMLQERGGEFNGVRIRVEGYLSHYEGALSKPSSYYAFHGAERVEISPGESGLRCLTLGEPAFLISNSPGLKKNANGVADHRVVISGIFHHEEGFVPHGPLTIDYLGWLEKVRVEAVFEDSCEGNPQASQPSKGS